MYYVIQQINGNPMKHYIAYKISRYITSKNSENVIMEFQEEMATKRKWAPKEVIILITSDREIFKTALKHLEQIQAAHIEKITAIKNQLDAQVNAMSTELHSEFLQIKQNSDV